MIKQVEYAKKKPNTRWHSDKKKFVAYAVDVRVGGRRWRNRLFPTKGEAEKFIENLKLENAYKKSGLKFKNSLEEITVSRLFEEKLKTIKSHSERVRSKRVFEYFANLLEETQKVSDVKTAHFRIFINRRLKDGVKAETVRRELNCVIPVFNAAAEIFPLELEGFDPPKMPRPKIKRGKKEKRVISEKEKDNICAHLFRLKTESESGAEYKNRVRIGGLFEIGWYLGLRFGEAARLKKSDFDFKNKTLRVERTKTGTVTLFEFLPGFLCDKIKDAANLSDTDFIYTLSGNYPKNFYALLKEAVEAAGLVYGRDGGGITFHSNRHSFVSRLVKVTDIATAQTFSGHSDSVMVNYYSHASEGSRQAAMEKLYGENEEFLTEKELLEIYEKVRTGALDFAAFCEALDKMRSKKLSAKA